MEKQDLDKLRIRMSDHDELLYARFLARKILHKCESDVNRMQKQNFLKEYGITEDELLYITYPDEWKERSKTP
jgi:hypothetical protein